MANIAWWALGYLYRQPCIMIENSTLAKSMAQSCQFVAKIAEGPWTSGGTGGHCRYQ